MVDFENKIMRSFNGNSYLTKNDIYELSIMLIQDKDLNNYLDTVTFERSKSNNLAMFLVSDKKLLFNYDAMNYLFNNWYRNLGLPLDSDKMRRFYNLYTIKIILHEMKYVSQVKES